MGIIEKYSNAPELLISNLGVRKSGSNTKFKAVKAIWDTGANHTFISKKLAQELQLNLINNKAVSIANGISKKQNLYYVDLVIQQLNECITEIMVADGVGENYPYDIIIGLDIINKGNFRYFKESGIYILDFEFND